MSDTLQKLQWRYATKKFDPTRKLSPEQLEYIVSVRRSASCK
ncbi:hypothetical protein [Parazoarcus communis]|nr:hypothetical protein [Parazoarcus communis]